jgi:hypothetical protein
MKKQEIKLKFHSKKILVITDFGGMDEAHKWGEKIKTWAKLPEKTCKRAGLSGMGSIKLQIEPIVKKVK